MKFDEILILCDDDGVVFDRIAANLRVGCRPEIQIDGVDGIVPFCSQQCIIFRLEEKVSLPLRYRC